MPGFWPVSSSSCPSVAWWYWSPQPAEMPWCSSGKQSQKVRFGVLELPSSRMTSIRQNVVLIVWPPTTAPYDPPVPLSRAARMLCLMLQLIRKRVL